MKRPVAIFLTVIYLLTAIGFSFNIHWCCNKINSISLGTPKPDKCSHCKAKSSCCKDVHITVKIADNQHGSSFVTINGNSVKSLIAVVNTVPFQSIPTERVFDFTNYHAPPFKNKLPVYLSHSVFRV